MSKRNATIGPMAVSTLALLSERPMHPYEMFQTLVARGQDELMKVRPGSLYHTVERLTDDALITEVSTEREGNRPERTVYGITDSGRAALIAGTIALLKSPVNEFPVFAFALSEAHNLEVAEVRDLLATRRDELVARIQLLSQRLDAVRSRGVPRRYLIEGEYVISQLSAQERWLDGCIDDLDSGSLDWDEPVRHKPPVA